MLEIEDILPSPVAPLVLPHAVPETVCEMQTPALFTKAQPSPQPQSLNTTNYARVNPLPSPATSSSIFFNTESSSSTPTRLPQSDTPPPIFKPISTATSAALTHSQPSTTPSWADEVAKAEKSSRSTPETVVPNWAYSGRICGSRPQSQPLVYPPPFMPTPHTQRPPISSSRYGPAIPPLRPQPSFPPPPIYDRPITIHALTLHPGDVTSYSTRYLSSSFLSHTGSTVACASHFKPPKRFTALILSW